MSTEYIWFKKGKESRRTADPAGKLPLKEELSGGREINHKYFTSGNIARSVYTTNGKRTKSVDYNMYGGKVVTEYSGRSAFVREVFTSVGDRVKTEHYKNLKDKHRDGDKPAYVLYIQDSKGTDDDIQVAEYYKDGKLHRDGDKPAEIRNNDDGSKSYETYYQNGKQHRDGDKPADLVYENGVVMLSNQYKNGVRVEGGKYTHENWVPF
jgi:hypothetical protein